MANILVNDILDELREEIKTLSKTNEMIRNLLDKYRKCLIHLQTICECNQKCNNKILVDSLESLYKTSLNFQNRETNELKDTKKKVIKEVNKSIDNIEIQFIKTKELDNNLVKTNDTNVENNQILCNENKGSDILIENIMKKEIKDMDSDYELSDQNDSHSNDSSGEEVDSNSTDFYKCEECYQLFDNEFELNFHKTSHLSAISSEREQTSNEVNGCQYCEKSYKSKNGLELHIGREHCPQQFKCIKCLQCFATNSELNEHKPCEEHQAQLAKGATKQYICDYEDCYKAYKSDIALEIHIQRIHKSIRGQSSDNYICVNTECKHEFKDRSTLIRHILRKHKPKRYKCHECTRWFATPENLKNHLKSFDHSFGDEIKCQECNQVFASKRTFSEHREVMHSSQSIVFKCKQCQFETRFKSTLKGHMSRSHDSSQMTVKCDYENCGKLFRHKYKMVAHKSNYHTSNRLRCDWPGCDFFTINKRRLQDHNRSHVGEKQFKCNFEGCPKTFVRNSSLMHHRRRHMKSYVCAWPECGHRFSDEKCLTAHTNGHMNVRPFKCYIDGCDKDYTNDKQMKQHIRAVHQIKPK